MNIIGTFFDFIIHLDQHMGELISQYGVFIYALLFLIVFCETGLVVTPFLPGDSLLFAAGTFAGIGSLNIALLFFLLFLAAIAGNTTNYWIGRKLSRTLRERGQLRLVKQENLDRTTSFFDRHGGKTIVITRFMPIIRTFAPFVAGASKMLYPKFMRYNILGGVLWVGIFTFGGFFFGSLPWVKAHFSIIIVAIILISLIPAVLMKFTSDKE